MLYRQSIFCSTEKSIVVVPNMIFKKKRERCIFDEQACFELSNVGKENKINGKTQVNLETSQNGVSRFP